VVPEVKITVIVSSSATRSSPSARRSRAAGSATAWTPATARSATVTAAARSSRKTTSASRASDNRSATLRLVTTCRMPAWATQSLRIAGVRL
jgi:hypothetical protein